MVGLILGFLALVRISKRITVITLLVLLCSFLLLRFVGSRGGGNAHLFLRQCSLFLSLGCPIGLLIGAVILEWKSRSRKKFKGSAFAVLAIVMTAILPFFWWAETCGPVSTALVMSCSYNLSQLGKAMLIYSNDNQGRYPESDQWCDLLLKNNQVELKHFLCPGVTFQWCRQVLPWPVPKNHRCYYAMNPNCESNSPADTVLLFETKGGWNKFGGSELMTTKNHWRSRCNVLFNDGRVEYVKTEQFEELKWGIE
jgi:hypothetical protein